MFKVGDKVKFINRDNMHFPEFFPDPGTIGEVVYVEENETTPEAALGCWVKWPKNSLYTLKTNGVHEFYCLNYRLEKVEEETK